MVSEREAVGRLVVAGWLKRAETQRILALLDGAGGRTRAVGGIVRDTILGRERDTNDIDLATDLLPQEVMARAEAAGISAYPTGIEHGTVTLKLGDQLAEVTTLRQDIETDGRRAVVQFGTDWRCDAERRDFTLNALYCDINGVLFDPLGGLDDCLAGRVRFIGDPDQRIAEDRLRVFRFFRFSASHGGEQFDVSGLAACRAAADQLGNLSAERVGAEIRRMLGLPKVGRTLQAMADVGLLDFDLEAMRSLSSYERIAEPPTLAGRLAIIIAATDTKAVQDRWRLANCEIEEARAVLAAERLLAMGRFNEAAYRHAGAASDGIVLVTIDQGWSDEQLSAARRQLAAIGVPKFPLSGRDLIFMGFGSNRELGAELKRLERAWIESAFTLDRKTLLEAVRSP